MGVCRRTVVVGLIAASAAPRIGVAQTAQAQTATAKPLRIVVPYPAGGPTDAMARLVARAIGETHKRTVLVENKPGASGAVGTREVARAEPDGATLVLGTNQTHVTNAVLVKEPGYDPQLDFVAVAGLAGLQHALVVPKSSQAASVRDLIASARAKPGVLNYGSTGAGSASHLAMELFMARAGIAMTHVPFRGAAPMAIEILAGRIDAGFATLPSVLGQIEAGEIKALALASRQSAPQLPGLPLLSAQGVTGADADAWLALFAPRATPGPVVAQLSRDIVAIIRRPDVAAAASKLGMAADTRDAGSFATFWASETRKWLDVVKAAALPPG